MNKWKSSFSACWEQLFSAVIIPLNLIAGKTIANNVEGLLRMDYLSELHIDNCS